MGLSALNPYLQLQRQRPPGTGVLRQRVRAATSTLSTFAEFTGQKGHHQTPDRIHARGRWETDRIQGHGAGRVTPGHGSTTRGTDVR